LQNVFYRKLIKLYCLSLLVSIFFITFIPNKNKFFLQLFGLSISAAVFLLSLLVLINFESNFSSFQFITLLNLGSEILNLNFFLGLDGISIFFFVLSSFLIFLCILFVWEDTHYDQFIIQLLIIELLLIFIFSVLDLLIFYIFFEAILIPMFLLIGLFGSRDRKIRAVYLLFFYTLFGSLFMLLGIIYIYSIIGTLDLNYIIIWDFNFEEQYWLWLSFFLSFASKIPLFPFHIWLPEAHVEAPTVGSVVLAGILLKLGVFGFLRFSLPLFPEASFYFSPIVYLLSLLGIIFGSLNAIRQTDLKRTIAYSSVAHMNLIVLGIFSFNTIGLEGAILQSISHGFVSSALFLLIGMLYERYHSRLLFYYSGLVHVMPIYSTFLLFFTLSNIALPGTSSFIGEFLILIGIFKINILTSLISCLGVVLCGAYSLWLYNRLIFGNLKISYAYRYNDLNLREFSILLPLLICVVVMGVQPNYFLNFLHLSVLKISFFYF